MKYIVLMILLALIAGCAHQTYTFEVAYDASYSSSGATRVLKITYSVVHNQIGSCDGEYRVHSHKVTTVRHCDLQKLEKRAYNVPFQIITDYPEQHLRHDRSS